MSSIKKLWAIEYSNGRLMQGQAGVKLWPTKADAQFEIYKLNINGKPIRVRVTVEKVI